MNNGHISRYSDSSLYDEVCVNCGATDNMYQGLINKPCPTPYKPYRTIKEFYKKREDDHDGSCGYGVSK